MTLSYNYLFLKIYCLLFAKKIGKDKYGNIYYSKKNQSPKNNYRERRWVLYKGIVEASKVPQSWNAWLHHMTNDPPKDNEYKPAWVKEHIPNLTGTPHAYEYKDKKNSKKIRNIYSIWSPNE